jgi:alpha-1,2-mannosyltransferase
MVRLSFQGGGSLQGERPLQGAGWLTRQRMIAYATILAIVEMGLFAFCVAGSHGLIVPLEHQPSTDFVSFYAAGALADAGVPSLAYDHAAHYAAEQSAIGFETAYNYFYYPPVFLLICAPLALLSYLPAFILFQMACACACFCSLRMIRRDLPVCVLLAFPGLWWAIGTGQNALLTAALFAAGTALLRHRPWLSGLCFGALCYKPHFGLLIPVALIAGGHWRAIASAAMSVLALTTLSVALFGIATWTAFVTAISRSGDVYAGHAIFMGGLTSPYGALMATGVPPGAAVAAQVVATLLTAGIVARVWRSRVSYPVRAAVLLAATPIAVPLLMFYDLMLVFVALLWLSRVPAAVTSSWRVSLAILVFLAPMLSGNLTTQSHWPVAFVTAAMAFGLTLAVAWRAPALAGSSRVPAVTGAA